MSELLNFGLLGFHHIADLNAADHILFLLALAAVYRLASSRAALWVITAFTIGHSVTLGLAVTGVLTLPVDLVEFLIPVTIVITCLENLTSLGRPEDRRGVPLRAGLAMVFGLVHGAGFANYLNAMFVEPIAVPLLGFNLGIEVGQVLILLAAGAGFVLVDRGLSLIHRERLEPFRARVIAVSAIVAVLASRMVWERGIW
jgi:hypothetical protein